MVELAKFIMSGLNRRAAVKSFGVKSRFVHFEFFRLTRDQAGMGKQGDVVALEVFRFGALSFSTSL